MENAVQELISGYDQPVLISDLSEGEILYANQAANEKLGINSSELIGTKVTDLFDVLLEIQQGIVWSRQGKQWYIHEEVVSVSERSFNRTVMQEFPIEPPGMMLDIIREMTAVLLHRLRSPITGTSGFGELILEEDIQPPRLRRFAESVVRGMDELSDILEQLEPLTSEPDPEFRELSLNETLDQLKSSLTDRERKKTKFSMEPGLPPVKADGDLLLDCLKQLLQNAIEHTPGEDAHVTVSTTPEGCIRISNPGNPIPAEFIRKMFYPFFTTKVNGLGLGLTLASINARAMDATLRLTSNSLPEGITFELCL